jgi:hypothetical protein
MLRPIKTAILRTPTPLTSIRTSFSEFLDQISAGKDLAWQFPVAALWAPGGDAGAGGSGGCESKLSNPQNGWV